MTETQTQYDTANLLSQPNPKQAYIWTREFSGERLQKIERVSRNWVSLFRVPGDRGHYARFQWLGLDNIRSVSGSAFVATIEGEECNIHLTIISAKEWFAKEVYTRALARTKARYPQFDRHRFIDGTRICERILEFLSEEWDLAGHHLWISLWSVIEDEHPAVKEEVMIEPCSSWGYPLAVARFKKYGNDAPPNHKLITVIRNVENITRDDFETVKADLLAGNLPGSSDKPISYDFNDIRDGFIELSSPELMVLNWADACPPLSEADKTLHKAAYQLDRNGIEQAISLGAQVNSLEDGKTSVLDSVVMGYWDHNDYWHTSDEDLVRYGWTRPPRRIPEEEIVAMIDYLIEHGANPDLHGPTEQPAIVNAALRCHASIVEALLKHGACAAVDGYWYKYPGEWPQTWDSPHFRTFHEHDLEARKVYDILLLNRPSPLYTKAYEVEAIAEAMGIAKPAALVDQDSFKDGCEAILEGEEAEIESLQQPIKLPEDTDCVNWLLAQEDKLKAEACIRYAMAFNTLDLKWLAGMFSPDITYESQSVFETLKGRRKVMEYLQDKLDTLRNSPKEKPRFELAVAQHGELCAAGFQAQGNDDHGWQLKPVTNVTFNHDDNGFIKSILVITVVPPPESALLSGLSPGF